MLRSYAVVVALHPEGMEVVLAPGADGDERFSLAIGNAVLVTTSSSYHLANRGGDRQLLVVVGWRHDAGDGEQEPEQHRISVEGDTAGGTPGGGHRSLKELLLKESRGRSSRG